MAKRTVITNKGMELLASSSQATGQYWWIGYYGLAYVPNLWKESSVVIPDTDECNVVNSPNTKPDSGDSYNGSWVTSIDTDQVTASMTRLTTYGDMIYNIFQGDLVGTGYYNCVSDGSAGGDLFGLTMYNTNIKKHYRYVLNEYGNNTLVSWIDEPTDTTGLMLGKYAYLGTDGFVKSDIPIPSPLYYLGNTDNESVDNYFPDFVDTEINGSSIYPYVEIWDNTPVLDGLGLEPDGTDKIFLPKVSVDYREYVDSQGYTEAKVYGASSNPTNNGGGLARSDGGLYVDTLEIAAAVDSGFNSTSWFAANLTLLADNGDTVDATVCREFWKLHSISNYNKYHAPVGSTGMVLSSDLSNRNMATVTKFFPISNYKVITTTSGNNTAGDDVEFATGISVSIDLDLAPSTKANADDTSNLTFFDKYDLSDDAETPTQTVQKYYTSSGDTIKDQFERNIFNTAHTSLKFNRIGIYAVPLRKCPFIKNVADPTGKDVIVQFEINPDNEPVLFAVVDWDNTVHLDDTGDGIHQFRADINLNIESPAGDLDADALVRDTTIFYNLYEDDAIRWYQNQLVANASTQNAITELEVKIGHIEKKVENALNVCPPTDLSKKFSPKNHNHAFEGLRNLFDAANRTTASGSLRALNTQSETTILTLTKNRFLSNETEEEEAYAMGANSTVLGGSSNFIHNSATSFIGTGINNSIYDSTTSSIAGGSSNTIGDNATNSAITAGSSNIIGNSVSSVIGAGINNTIKLSSYTAVPKYCSILSGDTNIIETEISSSITGGKENTITGSVSTYGLTGSYNSIVGGNRHRMYYCGSSIIGGGYYNYIDSGYASGIFSGQSNAINANRAFIGGGSVNSITSSTYGFIGAGSSNKLISSSYSGIVYGRNNELYGASGGSILGGQDNTINNGAYSSIVGGNSQYITADNAVILNGNANKIDSTASYAVVSGKDVQATGYAEVSHANGSFSEKGDAQLTRLLYKGSASGSNVPTMTLGDGNTYDFANHYVDKTVSFAGKASFHAFTKERTYTMADGVLTSIEWANGSSNLIINASSGNIDDMYTDVGSEFKMTIAGADNTDLNGDYTGSISSQGGDYFAFPAGSTGTGITETGTGTTLTITEPSSLLVSSNFIGWYNGTTSEESSYIYSERCRLQDSDYVNSYIKSGLFKNVVASEHEIHPDLMAMSISNGNLQAEPELDEFEYIGETKWLVNLEMSIISDPNT